MSLFKELIYDKVITALNLNSESVVFKGGYLIGLYQNGIPYVVDSSSSNAFEYERQEVIPVSEEISNETPSVNLADRSDYYFQYQIFFRTTRGDEVKTALKEFRDYFFDNKQHTIGGYTVAFKTSRGDKQATVPVQSGNFYSFYKINVYLTAIKSGYIKKDTDTWQMRIQGDVAVSSLVTGLTYEIKTVGEGAQATDFTLIGAADSNIGTIFTATGIGSGDGTVYQAYQTLLLVQDILGNSGNPIFNNATEKGKGFITTTTVNSKLQIFYNDGIIDNLIYDWIMNDLDKDTVFHLLHIFNSREYTFDVSISGGARTLLPNGIVILEFDWIEADI